MTETADQYKARLATYGEGKDPIAMQRETPRRLAIDRGCCRSPDQCPSRTGQVVGN